MTQEMLRRGFRPVTMPRALAEMTLDYLRQDRNAFETFGERCVEPLRDFSRTVRIALGKPGDEVSFWFTRLQEITVSSALTSGFLFGKKPEGFSKEGLKEAHDVLTAAWTPPRYPAELEREEGRSIRLEVPMPTEERLAECGFRDLEHLKQVYNGGFYGEPNSIRFHEFENRAQVETFYMHGWCAVLGEAIHKRTGWPVVGIFEPWEDKHIIHVACRAPDGTYIDARGMGQTREQLCEPYECWPDCPLDVREVSLEHLHRNFLRHPYYHEVALNEHIDYLFPELTRESVPANG
jgi:hypothetical protein